MNNVVDMRQYVEAKERITDAEIADLAETLGQPFAVAECLIYDRPFNLLDLTNDEIY